MCAFALHMSLCVCPYHRAERLTYLSRSQIEGDKKMTKWKEKKKINSGLNDDVQRFKQSIIVPLHRSIVYFDWLNAQKGKISFLLVHEKMSKCLSSMFKVYSIYLSWTKQLQMSSNRHISDVGVRFFLTHTLSPTHSRKMCKCRYSNDACHQYTSKIERIASDNNATPHPTNTIIKDSFLCFC